jgi:N-acyl-D-amino-acid deacylase
MDLDLKIVNGRIVDGTGAPAYEAELGVRDGRIAAIGFDVGPATRTIDAAGHVVAPGFVDVHTHLDAQLFWDPRASVSSWHGVTTVIIGNCGVGFAPVLAADRPFLIDLLEAIEGIPAAALTAGLANWQFETFPEFLAALDQARPAINVGALVPHSALRTFVMGREASQREATDEEVDAMCAQLRAALAAGAAGMSTSRAANHHSGDGLPAPSLLASHDEIHQLCRVMADERAGLFMAAIGKGFSIPQLRTLVEQTGCPVTFAAIYTGISGHAEGHVRLLDQLDDARSGGADIVGQVPCLPMTVDFDLIESYTIARSVPLSLGGDPIEDVFRSVVEADGIDAIRRAYSDPSFVPAFEAATDNPVWRDRVWPKMRVAECDARPEVAQMGLLELAARSGRTPAAEMIDLVLASPHLDTVFTIPRLNQDEAGVEQIMKHDGMQVALSDAGAHVSHMCDASYSTHFLQRWVRQRQAFTVEQAIKMLSADAARLYNLRDRGSLIEGYAADIVIFDPDVIASINREVRHDLPTGAPRVVIDAAGIDHVIVNGDVIRSHGIDADLGDDRPGKVLKRSDFEPSRAVRPSAG